MYGLLWYLIRGDVGGVKSTLRFLGMLVASFGLGKLGVHWSVILAGWVAFVAWRIVRGWPKMKREALIKAAAKLEAEGNYAAAELALRRADEVSD